MVACCCYRVARRFVGLWHIGPRDFAQLDWGAILDECHLACNSLSGDSFSICPLDLADTNIKFFYFDFVLC